MALANFFDKTALNASQILQNYNRKSFEETLNNNTIAIVFGRNSTSTHEGKAALELIIRLATRLYPNIQLINTTGNKIFEEYLITLCLAINPDIKLEKKDSPTVYLIAGQVEFNTGNTPTYFIGSNGWTAKFSSKKNIRFGKSINIFGAASSVCFGLSNVFRKVFHKQLPFGDIDSDFSFSVFHLAKDYKGSVEPVLSNEINIGELFLVGAGAIGNSVLWTFNNIASISGKINLIDKESIELSNLQRYILTQQSDIDEIKVDVGEKFLEKSKIQVLKFPLTWQEFLSNKNDWNIEKVAICVDSAEDRIAIQGALPKVIFNSWTQQESLGISRHFDFLDKPCLTCLYFPKHKKLSRSEEISINLGIPQHERIVRNYLATGKPVDLTLLTLVSQAKGIPLDKLQIYEGNPIEVFHSNAVCGGVLLRLGNDSTTKQENIEVPLAFESAMAGILLAAEIVIYTNQLRKDETTIISRLNLLRPMSKYINEPQSKHHLGTCICCDDDFKKIYKEKWNL